MGTFPNPVSVAVAQGVIFFYGKATPIGFYELTKRAVPHNVAPQEGGIIISHPDDHDLKESFKCLLVMALQETVTELHRSANFSNPLVYAQNSTTWSM